MSVHDKVEAIIAVAIWLTVCLVAMRLLNHRHHRGCCPPPLPARGLARRQRPLRLRR